MDVSTGMERKVVVGGYGDLGVANSLYLSSHVFNCCLPHATQHIFEHIPQSRKKTDEFGIQSNSAHI